MLQSDLAAELSMADVAASVNQSVAHFFRTFRLSVGQTPHQWRLNVRIAAAQSDLRELPLCTAEIAQKYGFSDQAHFTRIFRRIVGQTPGAWRRTH
ncbi:helix-turn-helix transcriptional regulator [Trinickia caryophylli]